MEEELKILEDFIKYYEAEAILRKFRGTLSISVDEQDIQALENLLTKYKQLEEENEIYKEELMKIDKALNLEEGTAAPYRSDIIESLKRGIETLKEIIDNSIPKSKVKEKIEEINEEFDLRNNGDNNEWWIDSEIYGFAEEKLQELLEEEQGR